MKILFALLLTVISVCFLEAENPSLRTGKRLYREAKCNYAERCKEYCPNGKPSQCECKIG